MKKLLLLLSIALCTAVAGICTACGQSGTPDVPDKKEELVLPTKTEVVNARKSAVEDTVQGYDFKLNIQGNFSALGLSATLNGVYDGKYRYNSADDSVAFKRTTSGALLRDSSVYVFNSGDSRIKLTMKDDSVKKLAVEIPEEQNLTMINLPIVALVDSVREANISSVEKSEKTAYAYACPLTFDKNNAVCNLLNQVMEKLEAGVSFKGIKLQAETSKLYFNIKNDKINDFGFEFQMNVDVKGVGVGVQFTYTQNEAHSDIAVPKGTGLVYKTDEVQSYADKINGALEDLKDDPVYALKLNAVNEFDPGWNKLAIKDSYQAMLYKNTVEDKEWFNHSYCYKAHSEADGRESYKYTLGNVNGADADNQGTWLISRKGTNEQSKAEGVTADTQFELLTAMLKHGANEIDCIDKKVNGTQTAYKLYLNRAGANGLQKKIIDLINTNKYGDVIEVDNYFTADNIIDEAEISVVFTDGMISAVNCKTELSYTPTGGDYTEYNIALSNSIALEINSASDFKKAQEYIPPTKVKGTLGFGKNLNDSEYYIL